MRGLGGTPRDPNYSFVRECGLHPAYPGVDRRSGPTACSASLSHCYDTVLLRMVRLVSLLLLRARLIHYEAPFP